MPVEINGLFEKIADRILTLKHFHSKETVCRLSRELKALERELAHSIFPLLVAEARNKNNSFFRNFVCPSFSSIQEAMKLRYVYVPIFYKLGMPQKASQLAQATFEYLFPQLHHEVHACLVRLFGESYRQDCENMTHPFLVESDTIAHIAYRIKSTHSIWNKIDDFKEFAYLSQEEFCGCIQDFIGIRWEMKRGPGQNRFDALINGVFIAPSAGLKRFRNQQLAQSSGFDREPVMKLCYVLDGKPIELQLLGGNIAPYLCAKGYASYKAKIPFSPVQSSLSAHEWNCRMGMIIQCAEQSEVSAFQNHMYAELLGEKVDYTGFKPFILDDAPKQPKNKALYFSNSTQPIYQLSQLSFEQEPKKILKDA